MNVPSRGTAFGNGGDGVAANTQLASELLDVHVEETGDGTSVVVACLLITVAALDATGVALAGVGVLSRDRNGGDGESEDGGELGEHREKSLLCKEVELLAGDSGRRGEPFIPNTLSALARFGSACDTSEIEYWLLFRFEMARIRFGAPQ